MAEFSKATVMAFSTTLQNPPEAMSILTGSG